MKMCTWEESVEQARNNAHSNFSRGEGGQKSTYNRCLGLKMGILMGNCLTLGWHSGKFRGRQGREKGERSQKSLKKHLQYDLCNPCNFERHPSRPSHPGLAPGLNGASRAPSAVHFNLM